MSHQRRVYHGPIHPRAGLHPATADPEMRIRRSLPILAAVLLIAAAVALIVTLRKHAPPEAARLLPGADGFFYVDLKWIRTFNAASQLPPVSHDPDYQKFVQETGFDFERDLDEAACAVHYPEDWGQGTAGSSSEPRFSWVLVGKFDSTRVIPYLKRLSASIDRYGNFDIYNIPLEGRTARVAVLSYDSVAVSNHPDPAVIRGIVDRSRKLASPFGGPSLLRKFYRHVPVASLSFAILRIQPAGKSLLGDLPGLGLLFPKPAVAVISARYFRALHLQAEAFVDSENDAQAIVDVANGFLSTFHASERNGGANGPDPDLKSVLDSLKVVRTRNSAILTATVPPGFINSVFIEAPAGQPPPAARSTSPQTPAHPAKPKNP